MRFLFKNASWFFSTLSKGNCGVHHSLKTTGQSCWHFNLNRRCCHTHTYTCVCVCACVCLHTHAHTHVYFKTNTREACYSSYIRNHGKRRIPFLCLWYYWSCLWFWNFFYCSPGVKFNIIVLFFSPSFSVCCSSVNQTLNLSL